MAQELDVALVPFNEWVARLEALLTSGQSEVELLRSVRALHLLRWFKKLSAGPQDDNAQALGFAPLSGDRAAELCPALLNTPTLGPTDAKKWLDYWRRTGFL